jgi:hypothetical protein
MTPTTLTTTHPLSPRQAADLAELVELEAHWENLRAAPVRTAAVRSTTQDLHVMQKAYEAFRARLAAYNTHYPPGHIPELLLNTPGRLGPWCRRMVDLYVQVEHDSQVPSPVQVLAKAYRWADKIAGRTGKACPPRSTPAGDLQAAIRELDALGKWCAELAGVSSSDASPA